MIIDDYISYSKEYKEKYGDKCIVLMQVGSFYELYAISSDIENNYIYNISDLCNIQISRKNKTIPEVSISNPLMAGFPLYTLGKYTNILLNNNYTIVLVEQITEPPNPERKVTEILSPGMNTGITTKTSNYMMVLYYEYINTYIVIGIAGIDLSTGKTFIYEAGSTKSDPEFANDEAFRFINSYNPSELIILSDNSFPLLDSTKEYILKNLNVNNILVHYKWDNYEYIDIMKKLVYQKGILEKSFSSKKSILSIIEVLNLEKYSIARIALCCLLQFAYEHNADIIKELYEPEVLDNIKYLIIEYNSAVQLNIVGLYNGDKPLIDILNRCTTSFGSRAFKERLLMPIIDKNEINKRYDDIDVLLKDQLFREINKKLNNIIDLERIKRKMIINKISPNDWCNFKISLDNAINIIELLSIDNSIDNSICIDDIKKIISGFIEILDLEEAAKYNLTDKNNIGNFFIEGIYDDVDNITRDYNASYEKLQSINNTISSFGINDTTNSKLENNDREGYYITITKKRFENALKINKLFMSQFDKKALATSTTYKLTNKEINKESENIIKCNNRISSIVLKYYQEFVSNYINKYGKTIDALIKYLTRIDIASCNAKNAYEYCYFRPNIKNISDNDNEEASYIKATNIRHPIIERINTKIKYVGNDVFLNKDGYLLYGINASGKSCFMKTIGLNIIMAQAGMFVASKNFEYMPYHNIFTRISGMDNIYKGMSSFTVEMTELRNILQRCNKYSIVLGDEICCGTESISAIAIVASALDILIKNNTTFIFATHLHELTDMKLIKNHIQSSKINVKHMHISTDEYNNIIYERKIQDGQGSQIYGLEVCKSLDMPYDFMKIAENTRKEVQGLNNMIINLQRSRYNADIIIDKCSISGCNNDAIDTHHINYQTNANSDGYFEDFHKNNKHNLAPLCKECHDKEHRGHISIKGYVETSKGIILKVNNK